MIVMVSTFFFLQIYYSYLDTNMTSSCQCCFLFHEKISSSICYWYAFAPLAHMQRPRQNEFVFDLFLASCAFSGVFRALSVDCWKALSNWLEVFVGGNLSTFGDHSCRWIRVSAFFICI